MQLKITRTHLVLAFGVFLCATAFALYTGHAWEDWYITYKASKNLATGNGLGFMPGEHVHTFTSVLGTLIPAALSFVTFNTSDDLVLWLFRILNAGLLAFSAVLLAKASRRWFTGLAPAVFLVGCVALDSKTLDFTINGMESVYTVLGLALFLYLISFHPVEKLGWRLGAVWALLQYARPDGFIFAALLAAGMLLFLGNRRATLRTIALSIGTALLLYLPWLLFTLWYYGSPLPHSMVAKSALRPLEAAAVLESALAYLKALVVFDVSAQDIFLLPANFFAIGSPSMEPLYLTSRVLSTLASIVWILPGVKPTGRIASATMLGFSLYLVACAPYVAAWYIPGLTLMAVVSLAFGLDALLRRLKTRPELQNGLGWIVTVPILAFVVGLTLVSAHQFRYGERIIERGNRQVIGEWLRDNAASPRETVFLECVGYIGFYSGLKMYDWPGMTSPEMVAARKAQGDERWLSLIWRLEPDWLVLRPSEVQDLWMDDSTYLGNHYEIRKIFNVRPEIDKMNFKPFAPYFNNDAIFYVIGKKKP